MEEQLTNYLKKLDVSDNETKIYLTLLKTGPLNARALAQAVGIKRTTIYNYVHYLMEKGLIIKSVSSAEAVFEANPPGNIFPDLVTQKIKEGKEMQDNLPQLLRVIQDDISANSLNILGNVEIKFYKGAINARKIYEESFKANEVRAFAKVDKKEALWTDNTKVFNDAFSQNAQFKWWEIIYGDSAIQISEDIYTNTDRYFFKFLPKHLKLTSEDILIYDGKVAIINFRGGATSIVLQSADFYHNLKELFDFIWNLISDPESVKKIF